MVLIVSNSSWYIANFRLPLIQAIQRAGYRVAVLAPGDEHTHRLADAGCSLHELRIRNKSINPLTELTVVWQLWKIYRRLRPDAILHFTPKPNIYGSFVAGILGIPGTSDIAGLGNVFVRDSLLSRIVRGLYRVSQRRTRKVFFQNPDDRDLFLHHRIVRPDQACLLPGSGVDLAWFDPAAWTGSPDPYAEIEEDCAAAAAGASGAATSGGATAEGGDPASPTATAGVASSAATAGGVVPAAATPLRFLMIARLIREKGVADYAAAAQLVRAAWPAAPAAAAVPATQTSPAAAAPGASATAPATPAGPAPRFYLIGYIDPNNPGAITEQELAAWQADGSITWLGRQHDVRPWIAAADCIVLPSYYREGTPALCSKAWPWPNP